MTGVQTCALPILTFCRFTLRVLSARAVAVVSMMGQSLTRGFRHIMWAAIAHHGNQPVRQIQSTKQPAIEADITLNFDLGADMQKVRRPKTSPWTTFIHASVVA